MDSLHQKFVRLLLKKGHQDPILMAQELVLSLIDAYNEAIADKALESIQQSERRQVRLSTKPRVMLFQKQEQKLLILRYL
jgi:hypothetical protein